jgi:hypothetical protein
VPNRASHILDLKFPVFRLFSKVIFAQKLMALLHLNLQKEGSLKRCCQSQNNLMGDD